MKSYDLVIQLGSQVQFRDGGYHLPPHTRMRTEAAAHVLNGGIAPRLYVAGGSNFGVRYNDTELLKPPVFTFEAFACADLTRLSEAAAIKNVLVQEYGCDADWIFAETISATTQENAEFARIILRRQPMFTGDEKIAVLTLLYHMEKALPVFRDVGLAVEPLFVENVLVDFDSFQVDRIVEYYSVPKGGKQYPLDRMRQLLTNGESLAELME